MTYMYMKPLELEFEALNHSAKMLLTPSIQSKYKHASTLLQQLHWLPVRQRTTFKPSVNMHKALSDVLPQYITKLVSKLQQTWPKWRPLQPESSYHSPSQKGWGTVLLSCWSPMLKLSTKSYSQHQLTPGFQV